jgi:hypothetical protein
MLNKLHLKKKFVLRKSPNDDTLFCTILCTFDGGYLHRCPTPFKDCLSPIRTSPDTWSNETPLWFFGTRPRDDFLGVYLTPLDPSLNASGLNSAES